MPDNPNLPGDFTPSEDDGFVRYRKLVERQLTDKARKASPRLIDAVTDAILRHGWFLYDTGPSHIELRRPNREGTGGAELTIWRQAGSGQLVGSLMRRYVDVARPRTYADLTQAIEVEDVW
jgi:hypothetical protein